MTILRPEGRGGSGPVCVTKDYTVFCLSQWEFGTGRPNLYLSLFKGV